eukprot:GILI01018616.1.p1 GENE.GILI01018616.1~~GILI01018616.1.p1  ORF type:complete len:105 (-),score=25.51 GILI01018616.1:252-566(-)
MFGRRVFASAPIPPSMFARLNISSAQQAQRRLPSLVPVSSIMARPMSSTSLSFISGASIGGLATAQGMCPPNALLEHIDLMLAGALSALQTITYTNLVLVTSRK